MCPWSWKYPGHMTFLIPQEMYSKFHVFLLRIVYEMWNFWCHWKCAGNSMFPCLGNVHEMWNFHKLRKCACQVKFHYNSFCAGNLTLNFLNISCSLSVQEIWLFSRCVYSTAYIWLQLVLIESIKPFILWRSCQAKSSWSVGNCRTAADMFLSTIIMLWVSWLFLFLLQDSYLF